ncbi:hypothetical protein P3X46_031200 [Hevea brasiliensis]|uniref:Transcription termination factor MTERF15, mitochondrial-like n=1 Tax=Hevea brasiliensis TaxID=3981 RepID=A0ABQ9KKB5_HEVBR|nr:hypothetical protein P3X46_031200 [Hevea brasiliensis]
MATQILHIRTALRCFVLSSKPIPTHPNERLHFLSTMPNSSNESLYWKQISLANLFQRNGFFKIWVLNISPLLIKSVLAYATSFQIDPDGFNKSVNVLKGIGFSEGTVRKFLMRIGIQRDEVNWIFYSYREAIGFANENRLVPLVDEFERLGFSKEFIRKGIKDVEKKIEFLVNTMKFNVGFLVEVPQYLGVSFEKQIVPRYNVIEYLRAKRGLSDEVGLKGMIKLSRIKFYNLYVKPYLECGKMFGRFSGDVQVKRQHPIELWKMFKQQMHPESKEDVKNLRSFLEGLV